MNHIERHDLLSTKDRLFSNMNRFCDNQKLNVFQFMPIQFILDLGQSNMVAEVDRFCQYFNCIEKVRQTMKGEKQQLHFKAMNSLITNNKCIQPDYKFKLG